MFANKMHKSCSSWLKNALTLLDTHNYKVENLQHFRNYAKQIFSTDFLYAVGIDKAKLFGKDASSSSGTEFFCIDGNAQTEASIMHIANDYVNTKQSYACTPMPSTPHTFS